MNKNPRNRSVWIWVGAVILLTGIVALVILLIPDRSPPAPIIPPVAEYWPTTGWRTSTPEEQGFDSVRLAQELQDLKERKAPIDSLLIIRNGYVVLDAYFYPFEGSYPHDLASVTKSITTTLVAIAAAHGKLDLDQSMISYFPDRTITNLDDRKQSITVKHLAGMVNGMESDCLSGDESTLDAMRSQPDWIQAALDREMTREPGKKFCYDSPGMHILSAILQETTAMTELDFASQYLFEPLGIEVVSWKTDPQGHTRGWGDLWLKPLDAAKIGYLWLYQGVWDGQQVVPKEWVVESVIAQTKTGETDGYGYGWWVSKDSYYALGRGGQYIRVYPSLNMIVVLTGGGIEYGPISRLIKATLVSPDEPVPANPEGLSQLDEVIAGLKQGQGSQPAVSLPETAREVSGQVYTCETNPAGVSTLRFEFSGLEIAEMYLQQNGQDLVWTIGLDGDYRMAPEGLTKGYWQDPQTFIIQLFSIGSLTRSMHFEGEALEVTISEADFTINCRAQIP